VKNFRPTAEIVGIAFTTGRTAAMSKTNIEGRDNMVSVVVMIFLRISGYEGYSD